MLKKLDSAVVARQFGDVLKEKIVTFPVAKMKSPILLIVHK